MNQQSGRALLDAIKIHGVENVSLLASLAGLGTETTRYQVWHELPSRGIKSDVEFNFKLMGLERWILRVDFPNHVDAKTIVDFLRQEAGATYGAQVLPGRCIMALMLIPTYEEYHLRRILDWLVSMSYIEAYELERMNWFRSISLNLDYYDIREGAWDIDWNSVEKTLLTKKKLALPESQSTRTPPVLDAKDIHLIQRLQMKLPSSISKLAVSAELNQFNARYHYNNHVKRYVEGYCVRAKQNHRRQRNPDATFLFSYMLEGLCDLAEVRACALALPFTTTEWKTDNTYFWLVSCPPEYIAATFRYVSKHTCGLKGKFDYEMFDEASEFNQPIPGHMFDEMRNKWRFEPRISLNLFHTSFDSLRSHCEYYRSAHCAYERDGEIHSCRLSVCAFAKR